MSLIYEYGERKERKGKREGRREGRTNVIENLLKSGMSPKEISNRTKRPLNEILEIEKKLE